MTISGRNSGRSRATVNINSKLEKSLAGYVTAAGAVSVGLMAIAQPVEAKIVYTPLANVPISSLTTIDLNGDGITDLSFKLIDTYHGAFQWVYPAAGNALAFGSVNHSSGPLPLPLLTRIGWKSPFQKRDGILTGVDGCHSTCYHIGIWQNQTNKYMAIRFLIDGKTHFGWMRLTVGASLTGYATGYAYETIADEPIIAGKTTGSGVEISSVPPAVTTALPGKQFQCLGVLARGVDGVAIWRREREEEVIGS
jgi:hypothetical protein